MKHKVNEWQELSLKKDIEEIRKSISALRSSNTSILVEFAIATATLLLDNFLNPDSKCRSWVFWILFIPTLLVFLHHIGSFCYRAAKKNNSKYKVFTIQQFIDSFDNEICYYVMMADTYCQMLKDISTSTAQNNNSPQAAQNLAWFYYIETWYYVNKAKFKLYSMKYKVDRIFTATPELIIGKNRIILSRLINIISIIEGIRISTNCLILNGSVAPEDPSVLTMNKTYDSYFESFVTAVNNNFGIASEKVIVIDFQDTERFSTQKKTP